MEFYNVKLKKKVNVDEKDFEVVTMKNGRPAAKAEVAISEVPKAVNPTFLRLFILITPYL